MSDCIFCKIAQGEIPANKIYEDEKYLAFLDINPVNPGHTLVIPKEHYEYFLDTPDELVCGMSALAKKIGKALVKSGKAEGFTASVNNGRASGQIVFHVHFHVMPRNFSDNLKPWRQLKYKDGEAEEVAKAIKDKLI